MRSRFEREVRLPGAQAKDARACWRSVPGRIGAPRCVEPSRVLVLDRPLKEEVVAPNTGDLQIVRCQPDPNKAVLFQHAL